MYTLGKKQLKYLNETASTGSSSSSNSSSGQRQGDGHAGAAASCVTFRLLNLRDDYAFALLRGGPEAPVRAFVIVLLLAVVKVRVVAFHPTTPF